MHGSKWQASHGLIGAVQYNSERSCLTHELKQMGTRLHFNNRCFFFASLWVFIPVSYTKSLVLSVRLGLPPPKVIIWIENRRANIACLAMYALRGIV